MEELKRSAMRAVVNLQTIPDAGKCNLVRLSYNKYFVFVIFLFKNVNIIFRLVVWVVFPNKSFLKYYKNKIFNNYFIS